MGTGVQRHLEETIRPEKVYPGIGINKTISKFKKLKFSLLFVTEFHFSKLNLWFRYHQKSFGTEAINQPLLKVHHPHYLHLVLITGQRSAKVDIIEVLDQTLLHHQEEIST